MLMEGNYKSELRGFVKILICAAIFFQIAAGLVGMIHSITNKSSRTFIFYLMIFSIGLSSSFMLGGKK